MLLIWAAWTSGRIADCLIPRALPWAKSFCPFRACCLYGLLPLQGIAAYMGFCPFRACSLYGLLGLQGDAVMGFWALLLIWAFGPSGRCCPMQISQNFRAVWLKLPSTPFCMVEITQHALKGQKLLAQGNALGINDIQLTPCKGKSFTYRRGFSLFY